MANHDATPTLNQLRCTNCNLYLSIGPVRLINDRYICGRCCNKNTTEGCIITIYNAVAQSFQFPCRYEMSGCKEKFAFGKMEQHELVCDKQPFFCPSLKKCEWQGLRKNIRKHFLQEHPNDVIENSQVIGIDLKESNERCYLFVNGASIYFVDLCFDVDVGLKMCVMQCGFERNNCNKYAATFISENNTKELSLNSQIVSFYLNKRNEATLKTELLQIEIIKYLECAKLRLELNFPTLENDEEPLKVLECPVCVEYMLPPIYLCDTGHSLCNACTARINVCSFCKSRLTKRRNYALEHIADMVYPKCKNSRLGCNFRSNLEGVKLHEITCERYQCPLLALDDADDDVEARLCRWYGTYDDMVEHVMKAHGCAERDNFSGTCNVHSDKESYLLFYTHGYMFKLCSKTVVMKTLQFNAQFVGPRNQVENFDVVVEFRAGRSKLVYREPCQLICDQKDPFEECLTIPYDILVPFIENRCIVRVHLKIVVNTVDKSDD